MLFGVGCIDTWLGRSLLCPMCKANVRAAQRDDTGATEDASGAAAGASNDDGTPGNATSGAPTVNSTTVAVSVVPVSIGSAVAVVPGERRMLSPLASAAAAASAGSAVGSTAPASSQSPSPSSPSPSQPALSSQRRQSSARRSLVSISDVSTANAAVGLVSSARGSSASASGRGGQRGSASPLEVSSDRDQDSAWAFPGSIAGGRTQQSLHDDDEDDEVRL